MAIWTSGLEVVPVIQHWAMSNSGDWSGGSDGATDWNLISSASLSRRSNLGYQIVFEPKWHVSDRLAIGGYFGYTFAANFEVTGDAMTHSEYFGVPVDEIEERTKVLNGGGFSWGSDLRWYW